MSEQEGMRTGALPDWTKHNHPAQLAIREQARRAEAAEAKVAEYEEWFNKNASMLAVHEIGGFTFEQEQTK